MKFRMDVQHYRDDKLIEPGTVVGDDCEITWRDAKGHPFPPSLGMTPLDEEAKRMVKETFQTETPVRDPTAPIPMQGTGDKIKVQPAGVSRPGTSPQAAHADTVRAANPPPNPAPTRTVPPPTNESFKTVEPPKTDK